MAKFTRCDRCNTEIEANSYRTDIVVIMIPHLPSPSGDLDSANTFSKDICRSCLMQLHDFMKPLPRVK